MDPNRDIINDALDLVARMDEGQRAEFFDLLVEKYGRPMVAGLNALGKPISPSYDPKRKRKTSLTSINRLRINQSNLPMKGDRPPRPEQLDAQVQDFYALDDFDEHVIEYHSLLEEAFSNDPEASAETMKAKMAALDDGADPGPRPENLRRAAS
jgi:hypothetical protein